MILCVKPNSMFMILLLSYLKGIHNVHEGRDVDTSDVYDIASVLI